jgi:hypothetical protein
MERYRYWEFIAFTYQKKLKKLVPELHKRTEHAPDDIQREHLFDDNKKDGKKKKVLPLFIYRLQDKYMWIALNFFIAIFGITLIVVSLSCRIFCVMCV